MFISQLYSGESLLTKDGPGRLREYDGDPGAFRRDFRLRLTVASSTLQP